jgi:hypothetical protein
LQQKRIPGAVASVDAESCFDGITHAAGSLCIQSWDVHPNSIIAMLIPIQRMKYFLRTAFGDSNTFFSTSESLHIPYVPLECDASPFFVKLII